MADYKVSELTIHPLDKGDVEQYFRKTLKFSSKDILDLGYGKDIDRILIELKTSECDYSLPNDPRVITYWYDNGSWGFCSEFVLRGRDGLFYTFRYSDHRGGMIGLGGGDFSGLDQDTFDTLEEALKVCPKAIEEVEGMKAWEEMCQEEERQCIKDRRW